MDLTIQNQIININRLVAAIGEIVAGEPTQDVIAAFTTLLAGPTYEELDQTLAHNASCSHPNGTKIRLSMVCTANEAITQAIDTALVPFGYVTTIKGSTNIHDA